MEDISGGTQATRLQHPVGMQEAVRGIDLSSKLCLFQAADMNFGLCAKVDDASKLAAALDTLVLRGQAVAGKERKGCYFYTVNNVWAVGFNDDALLVMGPQPLAVQPDMQLRIAKLLTIDSKKEDRPTQIGRASCRERV